MQDRLKFRIWYGPEKKMMLFNNPSLLDGKVNSEDNGGLLFRNYDHNIKNVHECKPEDFKIMQCTGLKDKNGKLIFEGDILEGYQTLEVSPLNSKMVLKRGLVRIPDGMFVATCHDIKENCTLFTQLHWSTTKVIGNVYQNPELLEDK